MEHELAHLIGERLVPEESTRRGNGVKLTNVDIDGLRKDGLLPQTTFILGTIRTT